MQRAVVLRVDVAINH